jgi:hypothetical protein
MDYGPWYLTWASVTNTGSISGSTYTAQYGGPTDWLKYWAVNIKGGSDLTEFFLNLRTAPGDNWATRVAVTIDYDDALLTQDNAAAQLPGSLLYPGTDRTKTAYAPPALTWNGYAWVPTGINPGWGSVAVGASFGGDKPAS